MPKVITKAGTKEFPYTKKGVVAAKRAALAKGAMLKMAKDKMKAMPVGMPAPGAPGLPGMPIVG